MAAAAGARRDQSTSVRPSRIAGRYAEGLPGIPEIELPKVSTDREAAWHLYVIRLHLERLRVGRDQVFRALRAENIGVNVHYIPVYRQTFYRRLGFDPGDYPVSEAYYASALTLPLFPGLAEKEQDFVVRSLQDVLL